MSKLKDWFKHSVTILWARVVAIGGVVLAILPALLSDPTLQNAIQTALSPQYIPFYLIAIGVITELARRRTAQ